MATVKIVRVDYRLIHGQIVAKWIKFRPVDRLVLVDDALINDEFMADIYRMSAGDKDVDITTIDKIQETLDSKNDSAMLIFKDVASAYQAFKNGFPFPELNVGAIQSAPNRKNAMQGIALSPEEYDMLAEMKASGVNVYLQPIPEKAAVSLESVEGNVK